MDDQRRGAQHDGVTAVMMSGDDLPHQRIHLVGQLLGEYSFADGAEFSEGLAAQISCSPHQQPFKRHAAEFVAHRGLDDSQNLADPGLSAPKPVTGMRGRGEPGDQGAVEVEERADPATGRAGRDLGQRI